MGEFLTWVNDRNVICTLNLGVSGTSKSWGPYCLGGEYGKPVINYDVSAMEHKHVGESSRHMRTAHKVLDSISDGRIWLIASANSLDGLPPELISRFQKGGIYFFDLPSEEEKQGILKLKVARYKLDPKQQMPVMPNWTGRDIDNCCGRAQLYGCSLVEAAKRVIPLHQSHTEMIENIRVGAANKYLSASTTGVYTYTPAEPETAQHSVRTTIVEGRKVR
jgi:AAA+ superfamily predicted ATPase